MLSKMQIAAELEAMDLGRKRQIANILDGLAQLAQEEIAAGEDFTVPGIARLSYTYRAPQAKGDKYKKGETYVGFGGAEITAEADSKPVKPLVKIRPTAVAAIKNIVPKSTDAAAQRKFLSTKVGKYVVSRKGK
jgi:nucleoid DNA-binding protein